MKKKISLLFILFLTSSCSFFLQKIAGDFHYLPSEVKDKMSQSSQKMIRNSFLGMDESRLADIHVHIVGNGSGGTGIWINPKMRSGINLYKRLQYQVYLHASGIKNENKADQEYIARLLNLQKGMGNKIKSFILAFDKHYKKNGEVDLDESSFYIPNSYVYELSKKYPNDFIPVISIHPYRKDALQELLFWARKGLKVIKWLPNSMGMDPGDKSIGPFYQIMVDYNMVLLTHTGEEKAVEGETYQKLGNPLRLRLPLNMGVKVIMAHMASLGECYDSEVLNQLTPCFDLSLRLLDDSRYRKILFADISGLTIHTRMSYTNQILRRQDLHHRLIFGSDYPLPAVNIIYRTKDFVDQGYLTEKERKGINEIYSFNPLLFDFVLKRTLKDPQTKKKFLDETFYIPKELQYILNK